MPVMRGGRTHSKVSSLSRRELFINVVVASCDFLAALLTGREETTER